MQSTHLQFIAIRIVYNVPYNVYVPLGGSTLLDGCKDALERVVDDPHRLLKQNVTSRKHERSQGVDGKDNGHHQHQFEHHSCCNLSSQRNNMEESAKASSKNEAA